MDAHTWQTAATIAALIIAAIITAVGAALGPVLAVIVKSRINQHRPAPKASPVEFTLSQVYYYP